MIVLAAGVATATISYFVLAPYVFQILDLMLSMGAPLELIDSVKRNYLLACILIGAASVLIGLLYAVQNEYDRYYPY